MGNAMQMWAHRGCGQGPQENSLWAFEQALNAGFKAVEFDVMLSADGVPMVHHDWRVGRCARLCDQPCVHDGRSVPSVSSAALSPEASSPQPWFASLSQSDLQHYHVAGAPVPTLQAVAAFCLQHGLQANVELKATHPANAWALGQAICQTLMQLAQTTPQAQVAYEHWVFSSFYHASLLPFKTLGVNWPLALLFDLTANGLPMQWAFVADALGAQAVHVSVQGLDATVVQRIQVSGRKVRVYTVNCEQTLCTLATLGVDGAFTDRMDLARFVI